MSRNLAAASGNKAPPPFWLQLPRVFTYPANGDSLVKIFTYAVAAAFCIAFLPLGRLWAALIWLAFVAYCFGILERTARGHLTAAEFYRNERTGKDRRPIKQVAIFVIFIVLALLVGALVGPLAGQVALFFVALVLPASIMLLALEERLSSALNPVRIMATIAGVGMPYLALCVFLFLLLQSAQFLAKALDVALPAWLSHVIAEVISMYFTVSMYYLMGYALYQNHDALDIDVQVDSAMAHQNLAKSAARGNVESPLLGPETEGLIADGQLEEAAIRIENRLKRAWDNNKLHDQYLKLLVLQGNSKEIAREASEYIPKLMREKKGGRAVEVYETVRKAVPDFQLTDMTLILPLATQACAIRHDTTAFGLLKGFDKRFPDSPDVPGVYFLAAKILLEKQNDFAMAQKIFTHMAKKYPQHPLAADAMKQAEIAAKMAASGV